jgi:hypothetical protein
MRHASKGARAATRQALAFVVSGSNRCRTRAGRWAIRLSEPTCRRAPRISRRARCTRRRCCREAASRFADRRRRTGSKQCRQQPEASFALMPRQASAARKSQKQSFASLEVLTLVLDREDRGLMTRASAEMPASGHSGSSPTPVRDCTAGPQLAKLGRWGTPLISTGTICASS